MFCTLWIPSYLVFILLSVSFSLTQAKEQTRRTSPFPQEDVQVFTYMRPVNTTKNAIQRRQKTVQQQNIENATDIIAGSVDTTLIVHIMVPTCITVFMLVSIVATLVIATPRGPYHAFVAAASFSDANLDGPAFSSPPLSGGVRPNRYKALSLCSILDSLTPPGQPAPAQNGIIIAK